MTGSVQPLQDADFARLLSFRDGLRRFLRWSEDEARRVGITASQHQLLLAVRGHGTPPSLSDIAAHLLLRHHSVVELVDRATDAGLVSRHQDERDHRIVRVLLTPEGERRLRTLAFVHLEELRRVGPRLSALWAELPAGKDSPSPPPPRRNTP